MSTKNNAINANATTPLPLLQGGTGASLTSSTGTGALVLGTSPTLSTPFIDQVNDTNGNQIIGFTPIASAVNYVQLGNNATGGPPAVKSNGSDTNINLNFDTKGTGVYSYFSNATSNQVNYNLGGSQTAVTVFNFSSVTGTYTITFPASSGTVSLLGNTTTGSGSVVLATSPTLVTPTLGAATATSLTFSPTTGGIVGTTTNDNASAGTVGEVISSTVLNASAVSMTNITATNITSISLTAGDWDVFGNVFISTSVGMTQGIAWTSSTSATYPDNSAVNAVATTTSVPTILGLGTPTKRFSLSTTTTVYLEAYASFATGATTGCGNIYARRAR
jgi:hypothetical protein